MPKQHVGIDMSKDDFKAYNITATEDAYVVESTTVNQIVEKVLQSIQEMFGNAKVNFKQWLQNLSNLDGFTFSIPEALGMIVEKTPEDNFRVNQEGLICQLRFKNQLSEEIAKAQLKTVLDYDEINAEASKRLKSQDGSDALKILSSLIEKNPGNSVMARDIAFSALEWGLNEQAYYLFKRVLKSRPWEPQTYLAIAKSLAKIKNYELALIYYEIAITAEWNGRFGEFRKIAALDYLNLLSQLKGKSNFRQADYIKSRYKTLKGEFNEEFVDLMVTISWNTDNTDIDLHVIEPSGEECYYKHKKTAIGGYITDDVTQGYGPEMYLLKKAKGGKFKVRASYYSSNRNRASTRTKIYATIYKNWGKKNETVINKVVTLKDDKEMHDIITVSFN